MEKQSAPSTSNNKSHFQTTYLGSVINIGGSLVNFKIDTARSELAKNTEIGSYALIKHNDLALLGQISRMKKHENSEEYEGILEL